MKLTEEMYIQPEIWSIAANLLSFTFSRNENIETVKCHDYKMYNYQENPSKDNSYMQNLCKMKQNLSKIYVK